MGLHLDVLFVKHAVSNLIWYWKYVKEGERKLVALGESYCLNAY